MRPRFRLCCCTCSCFATPLCAVGYSSPYALSLLPNTASISLLASRISSSHAWMSALSLPSWKFRESFTLSTKFPRASASATCCSVFPPRSSPDPL